MSHPPTAVVRTLDSVEAVTVPRCRGASLKILLGPESGVPNFITRQFTLEPGGRIPCHRHDDIEHEQVVLEGTMVLGLDSQEVEVGPGDSVFIPAGVGHWVREPQSRSRTVSVRGSEYRRLPDGVVGGARRLNFGFRISDFGFSTSHPTPRYRPDWRRVR